MTPARFLFRWCILVALWRSCVSQRLASQQGRSLRGVTNGAPFTASDSWIHQRRRQHESLVLPAMPTPKTTTNPAAAHHHRHDTAAVVDRPPPIAAPRHHKKDPTQAPTTVLKEDPTPPEEEKLATDNNYALDGYVQVDDSVERKEADDADDLPSGEATNNVPLTEESPTPKDNLMTKKPTETEEKDQIETVHDDLVVRDGDEDVLEEELDEVETEAKAFGGFGFLVAMVAVVFTAHQMLENPHGIYASICRLIITIVSCVIRAVLMPFRSILGHRGYRAGHMPISTTDPYVSHQMELT